MLWNYDIMDWGYERWSALDGTENVFTGMLNLEAPEFIPSSSRKFRWNVNAEVFVPNGCIFHAVGHQDAVRGVINVKEGTHLIHQCGAIEFTVSIGDWSG